MPSQLKRKRKQDTRSPAKKVQKKDAEAVSTVQLPVKTKVEENSEEESNAEEESAPEDGKGPETGPKHSSNLPSASELRAINEAKSLYKSNTFKAQLDLLLANVRPKEPYVQSLRSTLEKLHTHLMSLPSIAPVHPLETEEVLAGFSSKKKKARKSGPTPTPPISVAVPYPLPLPSQSTAWKVAFEPPQSMNVVGSWADGLVVRKPDGAPFGVDVVVEMPATLFQEKDYRNSRFFHKRAFYLACLAASLVQSPFNFDVDYESIEGDPRRTSLLLTPRKGSTEDDLTKLHAAIRIIPALPDDAPIPLHRLAPSQSNIRNAPLDVDPQADTEQAQPPTPYYNSVLALSFARASRARLISAHSLVSAAPSFRDGLSLLRIWANQRGFGSGSVSDARKGPRNYCVRGFEGLGAWWACVIEVLILGEEPIAGNGGHKGKAQKKRPLVGKGLSSYQLFRATLDFLSKHDFHVDPVFMKVVEGGQKFNPGEWTSHHEAVFVDATGTVNMLAGVPVSSLELLRHDAAISLQLLNNAEEPFDPIFLVDKREPHSRFDAVISVDLSNIRHQSSLDFPSNQAATLDKLASIVRKALNTRALVVVPLHPRSSPRPLTSSHPTALSTLTLGVIFDATHATRLVDHGPAASTPEVDAFRAFWGPKAELRRFKDGSIIESCVWDEGIVRVEDLEGIPTRIVRYILNHHFELAEDAVSDIGGDYGRIVTTASVRGRGEGRYKHALAAFDKAVKELKALEDEGDLPLMIVSARACSPSLRYTSVFPPSPLQSSSKSTIHPSTSYLPAFEISLQLERSSRWPDDLRAIQKVKLAFFETMARGLERRNGAACRACVVVDHDAPEIGNGCCLEVVLDGWAFRVRIGHDREVTLLQSMIGSGGSKRPGPLREGQSSAQERLAATHALNTYRRMFLHAPGHHSAILALHHRIPAFSYTVRLVKRWLGAHWLSGRVNDEAVELICAWVFLEGETKDGEGSKDIPACAKRGFVRVVRFLLNWEGSSYVPLYEFVREGESKEGRKGEAQAGKGSWRLMTLEDPNGTQWCEDITIPVAMRVREIAKATLQYLEEGTTTFMPLFEHPTTDYDFLIELEPHAVTRYWLGIHADTSVWKPSKYANLTAEGEGEGEPVRVAFDPAELFFRDLQVMYHDTLELFYDLHGGTTIGGVWNPSVTSTPHPWRVFLGFSSLPLPLEAGTKKQKPSVLFNKDGILAEIKRMGEGIIKRIVERKDE